MEGCSIIKLLLPVISVIFLFLSGCGQASKPPILNPNDYIKVSEFIQIINEQAEDRNLSGISVDYDEDCFLTRQEFCSIISKIIHGTQALRRKYIASDAYTESGKESYLYNEMFGGRIIENPEGYEEIMLAKQMEQALKIAVRQEEFYNEKRALYFWDTSADDTRFEKLFADFDSIGKEYVDFVKEACHIGYIDVFFDSKSYNAYFSPIDFITVKEATDILIKIYDCYDFLPVDCVKVSSDIGYINLCIGKIPSLLAAKSLLGLMVEKDSVVFTTGLTSVSFCLWYNCSRFGMLELPLDYYVSDNAAIEVTSFDKANRQSRIEAFSYLLFEDIREEFINWANSCIDNEKSGIKTYEDLKVVINKEENGIYRIFIMRGFDQ